MTIKTSTYAAPTRITSALAAIACSGALLLGTVAPAHAGDVRTDAARWEARVTADLNARIRAASAVTPAMRGEPAAVMVAEFDQRGQHVTTRLARSSGDERVDREAVRIVTAMTFPALPDSLHGRSRVVPVEVFFGNAERSRHAAAVRAASNRILAAHRGNDVPVGQSQY